MTNDHKSKCCDCGEFTPDPQMRLYVRCDKCTARLTDWMAERVKEAEERRKQLESMPMTREPFDRWSDGDLITYIDGREDHSFEQAQRRQLFKRKAQ